jgi:hypothetical protein
MIQFSDVTDAVIGDFGEPITYITMGGRSVPISAVTTFDRSLSDTYPGITNGVLVRLADLPAEPQKGDKVQIGNATYTVFAIRPDQSGGVVLYFHG